MSKLKSPGFYTPMDMAPDEYSKQTAGQEELRDQIKTCIDEELGTGNTPDWMVGQLIRLFTSYRLSHEAEMKQKLEKWSEDTHYCTYEEESDDSRFRPICKWCGETELSSSHDIARLLKALSLTPNAEKDKT
jgi:hypothetical protein